MKILSVVTTLYIYHGCFTWKKLWEVKFTLGEFTPVKMKNCDLCNVSKHREINIGENYITLDISLKVGSLGRIKITSSYPKYYFLG